MAWRSSGTNNDDMVDNLTRFGVITTPAVEAAFRAVDRIYFVPQNRIDLAHSDQPLKEDNVHISAPHIYGTIVESLDLEPGSSQSFLNIGSGTGYLSCIASQVLGADACCYGVEIFPDVVEHCKGSLVRWRQARSQAMMSDDNNENSSAALLTPSMDFVCGNGLEIDASKGECQFGFDRIYVGASVHRNHLNKFANLLRPGGILVAPVEDDLIKVARLSVSGNSASSSEQQPSAPNSSARPPRSLHGRVPSLSDDFTMHIVSGVRFAPLLRHPATATIIPSRIWNPSVHHNYPKSFRESIKQIMLCSHAPVHQAPKVVVESSNINVASKLPKDIWMKILSYTHRSWFEQPYKVDELFLRQRLRQEQQAAQRAKEACAEAERRLRLAERERDGYKLLAMRWQSRLRVVLSEANKNNRNYTPNRSGNAGTNRDDDALMLLEDLTQAATSLFNNDSFFLRMSDLSTSRQRLGYDSQESSDVEDEEDLDEEADGRDTGVMNMEAENEGDDNINNSNSNEMDDSDNEEDDSEAVTLAASPTESESSFYRHVSESLGSQTFFT